MEGRVDDVLLAVDGDVYLVFEGEGELVEPVDEEGGRVRLVPHADLVLREAAVLLEVSPVAVAGGGLADVVEHEVGVGVERDVLVKFVGCLLAGLLCADATLVDPREDELHVERRLPERRGEPARGARARADDDA